MKPKIKTISIESPYYPLLLKEIPNPPLKIHILGELAEEQKLKIAIVGTRKATTEGRAIAKKIAQQLAEIDIVVVSGLAMGIDAASHEGALLGNGPTMAVLACGLDTIYPRQNENLARKILARGGAIISEYPIGSASFPSQFLERNRIISGLSAATVIIEAPERSGSLATANWAAEQGREIFVVPGPINHPNYKGSHKLIRDGARLISSVEDILEDLGLENSKFEILNSKQIQNSKIQNIKDENQLLVIKIIQEAGQPLSIDRIIELAKLEPQVINQTMAILVINGFIKETEKGYTI
ncbi:DNA-protecting protein DprA [Candidatus Wolfebacteria bacterium CG03_land_8_20_14_0_80_40_12]|uniref:DNA-protecting protein DprA n=1 Tax=Candidatus Wolfebacteria bacterium CG03_land_8_20_14_0_80_40_12 TaxID=1975069 RepID=A0A2M7B5E3_9BACT|nr:MAG: DNA-protecting protein DprA [Candidatus Wolfebacteria bacterium CG03_land_8_20_14_0_80_40_12]